MIKLITSKRGVKLPLIYFVEREADIVEIPVGIPFIRGHECEYENIVQTLEFEILLKSALETGLDISWFQVLEENGFHKVIKEALACTTREVAESGDLSDIVLVTEELTIKKIIDKNIYASYVVDLEVLKNLEIIPTFLKDIEKAIEINIHNGFKFNSNLYNKKLGLPLGTLEVSETKKNLIIIDISSSIPKSISKTILALSKTMASQFYADLLITGSKSTLYEYNDIDNLNVNTIYSENGTDNDQIYFRKLLSDDYRKYDTVIVFGDDHSPSRGWNNAYNKRTDYITLEKGKELCKWEVESIISFHTQTNKRLAGYADWFDCKNIEYMSNWVKYFN